jgi:transposase
LEKDPTVSGSVLFQRLIPQGYTRKTFILREYLQEIRPKEKRAYLRFVSAPGKQFQVDCGHFGSLLYGKTTRKLYCLAVIEAPSRLLYGEFAHSQKQDALHQALLNAFLFFEGVCLELVVDNMATTVTEREGSLCLMTVAEIPSQSITCSCLL